MSANSTLDRLTPHAEAATGGLTEFAADGSIHSGRAGSPVKRPGLLLRAALVLTVLLAAATAFAAAGAGPHATTAPVEAHLSGTLFEMPIGSGFEQPEQIAVDSSGNLYIADVLTNNVYKETPAGGVYTQSILRANLGGPVGVTVDSTGNVYIANSDDAQVLKEKPESDGTYSESIVPTSGLGGIVFDLAVDSKGNLYIADAMNNRIVKEAPYHEGYVQSVIPATGLSSPEGVAVDSEGNVYIADTFNNRIVKETAAGPDYLQSVIVSSGLNSPGEIWVVDTTLYIADTLNSSIGMATYNATTKAYTLKTVVTGKLNAPTGVAVDSNGDLFVADTNNKRVIEEAPGDGTNFGAIPLGQTSSAATLTFTFDHGGKIGAPVVEAYLGGAGAFKEASGTCAKDLIFATGSTCTILVTFKPASVGFAYGVAELTDSSGAVVASAEISGTGVGTGIIYPDNAIDSKIGSGLETDRAVAVDLSGNVYITDSLITNGLLSNNQVLKITPDGGQSAVVKTLENPVSVAVDRAGDVFITDAGAKQVLEETPASDGTYTQSVVYAEPADAQVDLAPGAIAVDREGNLWVAFAGEVTEFSLVSPLWKATGGFDVKVASGTYAGKPLPQPESLAIDDEGNIYVGEAADSSLDVEAQVMRYAPTQAGYAQLLVEAGTNPTAIAVDPIGNVFLLDENEAYVFVPTGLQHSTSDNSDSGYYLGVGLRTQSQLSQPKGVAVDNNEVAYIANTGSSEVLHESWSSAPNFDFPNTVVDQTSGAIVQSILDIGNAAVDFTVPTTGQNPTAPSGFVLNTGEIDACPVLTASSEAETLVPGVECSISVSFSPTTLGNISGNLVYKANVGALSQFGFDLSGKGIATIPTITWPTPASIVYGTPLSATQLNAKASYNGQTVPGTFTYSPGMGAVLGAGNHTLTVQFVPSGPGFSSTSATESITVTKAQLIAIADSFSRSYGSPNPAFTVSFIGLENGDTQNSLDGTFILSTEATQQFPWGYYPISVSNSSPQTNYDVTFVDGTLVITQVPLTVTANNETAASSSDIPNPYPCTITGFVNGDTSAVVSGACGTNAQSYSSSPAGTYTVTPAVGTLSAVNYTFANFVNGTLTLSGSPGLVTIGSGFSQPEGVAVDASGNVYVTDTGFTYIVKETLADNSFTQSDVGSTDSDQLGVAVDKNGNLYVTASEANEVWELTYADGSYSQSVIASSESGVNNPWGIAVDGNGNVFVANLSGSNVLKLSPNGYGEFLVSTIASSSGQGLNSPEGLAVDANGNVYIADSGNNRVVIMNNSAGSYSLSATVFSSLHGPDGVAVDKDGNVYISDSGDSTIYEETLVNGSYTQSTVLATGLSSPGDVAVDANGNLYITDTGNARVVEVTASSSQSDAASLGAAHRSSVPRR